MKYIKSIAQISAIGCICVLEAGLLSACASSNETQAKPKGAFVVIEETAPNKYKIKDQYPSDETRVILKKLDGSEKILSKEEMDKLLKQEAAKIDNGTSPLTKPQSEQMSSGGMSLGQTILASAAGAVLGSWIGSKLFNNQNFASNQRRAFTSPSSYQRSMNNFKKSSFGSYKKGSSGFFSRKSSGSSRRSFGFGG